MKRGPRRRPPQPRPPQLCPTQPMFPTCRQSACGLGRRLIEEENGLTFEYTHAWARALETSADSAPASGSGELESPLPTECVRSSTTCASLIFSSSCGTTRATGRVGRVQATAGLLLGEFERTISGKKKRGTIWSMSCSRSMPVTFPTRAAGYTACSVQARWASLCRAGGPEWRVYG